MPAQPQRKDDVIQIRASAETKALLQSAAAARGQKLSEFMLDTARRQAEETLLERRIFFLEEDVHARLLDLLDHPPALPDAARVRLKRKAPW